MTDRQFFFGNRPLQRSLPPFMHQVVLEPPLVTIAAKLAVFLKPLENECQMDHLQAMSSNTKNLMKIGPVHYEIIGLQGGPLDNKEQKYSSSIRPVSYTHLTLPTIYSV